MSDVQEPSLKVTNNGHIAIVTLTRPPHNHVSETSLAELADALDAIGEDANNRAIVLRSEGKSFCAGADFAGGRKRVAADDKGLNPIYHQAARLFAPRLPMVAAIEGAAIGAGLGLALAADFRVASDDARFSANFVKLGLSPGFALSRTLPDVLGLQKARLMLLTGRRIKAEEAFDWGLIDILTRPGAADEQAMSLAAEIAANAPLALRVVHRQLRGFEPDTAIETMLGEDREQRRLLGTADFLEGVAAVRDRRPAEFRGL
jgi:enoyl-CoA hydratase/carnithine racemase